MQHHQRRHPNVVSSEEVERVEYGKGSFQVAARRLGAAAGSRALGCALLELEAGKTAYPFHFHGALEEAIYILEGRGLLRLGGDEVPVQAGDYVAMPAGPEYAHALRNPGEGVLCYLCVSGPATAATLDIISYPDSQKVSFASGIEPGRPGWKDRAWAIGIVRAKDANVSYFAGEPLADE